MQSVVSYSYYLATINMYKKVQDVLNTTCAFCLEFNTYEGNLSITFYRILGKYGLYYNYIRLGRCNYFNLNSCNSIKMMANLVRHIFKMH